MSEKKWTPGPWDVQYGNDAGYDGGFREWYEAGPAKVEVVRDDEEAAIANAHLIATAPELYDALNNLLKVMKILNPYNGFPQAETVLAKARGDK